MKPLSKRTESFTDSVIRRMTRVSMRYGAVNLSQGFPDFDPPRQLTDALADAAHRGPHQYAVTWGAQNFREALARKQSRFMGMPVHPDTDIVVTCGSTEAMMCAMMTVADPGDRGIVFSPFYVLLDISEYGWESDTEFCEALAQRVGVGAVPGSAFFREPVNHLIRMHFAKQEKTLTEALCRLESMKKKMIR